MNSLKKGAVWHIRTMQAAPSPASDDVATERCHCYGNR
jgi:hypothetical protein